MMIKIISTLQYMHNIINTCEENIRIEFDKKFL